MVFTFCRSRYCKQFSIKEQHQISPFRPLCVSFSNHILLKVRATQPNYSNIQFLKMYKFHQKHSDNLLFLESEGGLLCSCGPFPSSSLLTFNPSSLLPCSLSFHPYPYEHSTLPRPQLLHQMKAHREQSGGHYYSQGLTFLATVLVGNT